MMANFVMNQILDRSAGTAYGGFFTGAAISLLTMIEELDAIAHLILTLLGCVAFSVSIVAGVYAIRKTRRDIRRHDEENAC